MKYEDCTDVIDNLEEIEQTIMTTSKSGLTILKFEEKVMYINMSDSNKDSNKDGTDGGVSVNKDSINCLFCRCKRNTYHKETKTTTENDKVSVNVVEDRSSFKVGRGTSPDDGIFKPEKADQVGGVELCSRGWSRNRKITPEHCEER